MCRQFPVIDFYELTIDYDGFKKGHVFARDRHDDLYYYANDVAIEYGAMDIEIFRSMKKGKSVRLFRDYWRLIESSRTSIYRDTIENALV